ncbi:MAG: ABC transporter ATP-binding protein [Candidatus Thorarchaeota archaeon]
MSIVLDVIGLEKNFDGVNALAGFSCSVKNGEILGLIGPNGAGKTTFFNIVSGFLEQDNGEIIFNGSNITGAPSHRITNLGISRTFQSLRLIRQISVLDNVLLSFQNQLGEKLRNVFLNRRGCQQRENESREEALALLDEVTLAQKANDPAEELSYGQQKLLSLACCMAAKSDVLLLDEPAAGIAPEMTIRMLEIIRGLPANGRSVILIEHNLDTIMKVCDRVIFMDAGAIVSEGTPGEVRNDPKVIEAYID